MKHSANDRINMLLDDHSFDELPGCNRTMFITGTGKIEGRKVFVAAHNTDSGDAFPDVYRGLQELGSLLETALREEFPLIYLADISGRLGEKNTPIPPGQARILAGKKGMGHIFYLFGRLSGRVPTVAILLGKIGASFSFPVAQCDAVVMMKEAGMSIGRPDAVTGMTGEKATFENLAGAEMHCRVSGTGHVLMEDEEAALSWARKYLSFFPDNYHAPPIRYDGLSPSRNATDGNIPANPYTPFDIRNVISALVDANTFLELKELHAREVVTGLARIKGRNVGIIANNSKYRGGVLFPETCAKMSAFISCCDAFNIPLVFLADVPGFMVGAEVEHEGIIEAGALLFTTIAKTSVPRLSIVVRKVFSAGLYAMSGPGFSPDEFLSLPHASMAIFGRSTLEGWAHSRELTADESQALEEMIADSEHPDRLKEKGLVDDIIGEAEIRDRVSSFLEKHDDRRY